MTQHMAPGTDPNAVRFVVRRTGDPGQPRIEAKDVFLDREAAEAARAKRQAWQGGSPHEVVEMTVAQLGHRATYVKFRRGLEPITRKALFGHQVHCTCGESFRVNAARAEATEAFKRHTAAWKAAEQA